MNPEPGRLLTVRWRDRSFVLRVPEEVEELALRLGQKGFADLAASIRGPGSERSLSDEEREAVCSVLTDAEGDAALRRAFTLLCRRGSGGVGHERIRRGTS